MRDIVHSCGLGPGALPGKVTCLVQLVNAPLTKIQKTSDP